MNYLNVNTETENAGIATDSDITRLYALRNSGKTLDKQEENLNVRNMTRVQKEKDRKRTNLSAITAVMEWITHFRHSETHQGLVNRGPIEHRGKRKSVSKQPGLL